MEIFYENCKVQRGSLKKIDNVRSLQSLMHEDANIFLGGGMGDLGKYFVPFERGVVKISK